MHLAKDHAQHLNEMMGQMEQHISELNNKIDSDREMIRLCERILKIDEYKSFLSLKLEIFSLLEQRKYEPVTYS